MSQVAYIDLEVSTNKSGAFSSAQAQILEIGALFQGNTFRGQQTEALEQFIAGAAFLAGHNLVDFDLPHLRNAGFSSQLLQLPSIDTLYLSPLLFARRAIHRLNKGYLDKATQNNPVADAQLTADLLSDLRIEWNHLSEAQRSIYVGLLGKDAHFRGFFDWVSASVSASEAKLAQQIQALLGSAICTTQNLTELVQQYPIELAYALAQIQLAEPNMVAPQWALKQFPALASVLYRLRGARCNSPACDYCRNMLDPVRGLNRHYGYPSFRSFEGDTGKPLQQQVVEAALDGDSLLAIFPTGGGKSLTFQLPALITNEAQRALTVVISPLQSLMKDQVDVLLHRHDIVNAVTINGLLSPLERRSAANRVANGEIALLYLSPEALRSRSIVKLLQLRHIARFVIDEPHCFSAWGQDFRTDYQYIARFIRKLHEAKALTTPIPVSCFTATARPAVVQDIRTYFERELGTELRLFRTLQTRPNLRYHVVPAKGKDEKNERLLELLSQHEGPKIVYVSRTKKAEDVAVLLMRYGFSARPFHGKLNRTVKMENQNAFMEGKVETIVATTAFGMGVDKDNVAAVIHYDISDSLENYVQESGRAGRSASMEAFCYILYDEQDLNNHFQLLNNTRLNQKEVARIWNAVKYFRKEVFSRSALELATKAGWDTEVRGLEVRVKAALAALEQRKYLVREENDTRVFATSILAKNAEEANADIEAATDRFQGEELVHAKRVFSYIIGRPRELKADFLAERLGLKRHLVERILNNFRELGLIGYELELEALAYQGTGKHNASTMLKRFLALEQALFAALFPDGERIARESLRRLNQQLLDQGLETTTTDLRAVLNYWAMTRLVEKSRLDAQHGLYRIRLRKDHKRSLAEIGVRAQHANKVLALLLSQFGTGTETKEAAAGKRMDTKLVFTIEALHKQVEATFSPGMALHDYERTVLFFHFLQAIELERGLIIFYQPMRIQRLESNLRKGYTKEDHQFMEDFYERRIRQIHIVGRYATLAMENPKAAAAFSKRYFELDHADFVAQYFPTRTDQNKLKRALTESKFHELFAGLSDAQLRVINDKKSERILVAAGPGSGKTRILVHKVAALLWLENVKPEQFLMLTFSRPAANEFRSRLQELAGNVAWHIDVHTYHSYAFHLLGQLGDLQKSDQVIARAVAAIQAGDAPMEKVENKSVLVVDEYQDVSAQEYALIEAIIEKADNIRVIAVGDDDQNIYAFRGSSVEYMRSFQQQANCKTHELIENFRAAPNLVALSNRFLRIMSSDRVKSGVELRPVQTSNGRIGIYEYTQTQHFMLPLVEQVASAIYKGTTGILTRTNEEAMLIHNQLLQRGVQARLVTDQSGFRLGQLLELQWFTKQLASCINPNHDRIAEDDWKAATNSLQSIFASSNKRWLANAAVNTFAQQNPSKFYEAWRVFLFEARTEDFLYATGNEILVSTMHKAKGKEFDRVQLLLSYNKVDREEDKRVVYVALTRARKQLLIHTKLPIFRGWNLPDCQYHSDANHYPAPNTLWYGCGMKDVYLGFFEKPQVQQGIAKLHCGMPLTVHSLPAGTFGLEPAKPLVTLSKKGREQLETLLARGYNVKRVVVNYLVRWHDKKKKNTPEITVVLPLVEVTRG